MAATLLHCSPIRRRWRIVVAAAPESPPANGSRRGRSPSDHMLSLNRLLLALRRAGGTGSTLVPQRCRSTLVLRLFMFCGRDWILHASAGFAGSARLSSLGGLAATAAYAAGFKTIDSSHSLRVLTCLPVPLAVNMFHLKMPRSFTDHPLARKVCLPSLSYAKKNCKSETNSSIMQLAGQGIVRR